MRKRNILHIKSLEVTIMKKSRKIMMVLCVVALLVSVLAIPASAATNRNITRFLGKVLSGMPR